MIILFFKRALKDILNNRFLNVVTIITIALSILIVSAFILFFVNTSDIMNSWKKGIRLMVYLKPGVTEGKRLAIKYKIQTIGGVQDARFISKDEALERFKNQMKRQSSLLKNLKENPLPDAFEIRIIASSQDSEKIELLASQIEALPSVEEVEYGQLWLGRFTSIFNLFRLTGYTMGCIFFMATVFIVANTIRLVLYSRREEVEIMRLVGAADRFIKAPFYIEGLIQGALGGFIGLFVLFITFIYVSSRVEQGFSLNLLSIRFLSPGIIFLIILCSMFVGWLGCFLSLKQFFKV